MSILTIYITCELSMILIQILIDKTFAIDLDNLRNSVQLIQSRGFAAETHAVITSDGYILNVFRIRNPYNPSSHERPVILWHGITQDSDVWLISAEGVLNGKGVYMENNLVVNDCHQSVTQNLAFTLSACGYDVWLPNFRGTTYSMGHLILDPVFNRTYWQYTFTELGLYDVPAVVQYVLRVTDKSSVAYIGHSLGSTAMFIQLSLIPEFERLVKPFIALAPFVFMSHMTSTLRYALTFEPTLSSYTIPIGIPVTIAQFIGVWMCGNQYFRLLCADMYYSASGYDPDNLNTTRIPIYVSHTGSPYSSWVYAHVGQLIRNRGFRLFDYGTEGNWERYGQSTPPDYPLSRIKSKNIAIFYGFNDLVANVTDVQYLIKQLNVPLLDNYEVPYKPWAHTDFNLGVYQGYYINKRILTLLK